jgi:hypothetical protein
VVDAFQVVLPQHGGQVQSLGEHPADLVRLVREDDDRVGVGDIAGHTLDQIIRRRPGGDDVGQPDVQAMPQ